ncbi:MAG TPA: hypothetical protein VGX03_08590 [Candidatus Binatia bacterium]|nr:hypothetical protein [Candidatus Binatia bacterium]
MLVAPHGGRRPADAPIRDSLKVNDLYTADLTALLAARTGSYALINHAGDRNDLDLNRISQVRVRAPWFLDAMVELLSALVARYGAVRVFFIHGWNVVQPVCDLGMGLKQRGDRVVPASKAAAPTLSAPCFTNVVLPFRAAALAQGIDVALGRRYPAADKDNLMQVFSPRFAEDASPAIRTLAALSTQEKIDAVQLELGVGLRWPGPERDRFMEVFCHTLGKYTPLTREQGRDFPAFSLSRPPTPVTAQLNGSPLCLRRVAEPTRLGLHFHDPLSGLGVMGGIEFSSTAPTQSGRLMLSLGGTEMVLFTGEDEATADSGRVQVGGFVWRSEGDGLTISYRGPVMRFSHPQAFIRLEEGLAASWIEPAEITLHLMIPGECGEPPLPLFLAHLRGEVRLRDRRCAIDAWGFLDMLKSEETGRLLPRRLLSLPFGPDLGIFLSWVETPDGPRSSGVIYHRGTAHPVRPEDWEVRYTFAQGRPTAFHLSLTPPQPLTLHCSGETVTAIPIVRHAPQGSALAVTFGLSRTAWQGREARGVYEFSERRRD